MRLPRLLVVTDRFSARDPLAQVVATAVQCGARGVVLRDRDLPAAARDEIAASLRSLLDPVAGVLITAGRTGDAVHLAAAEPFPDPRPTLVGRSCHGVASVDRAAAEGCDYAFVSPIYATASKPGYGPALGVAGLAALCRTSLPVYALGGVLPERVNECLAAGAYGVAVMGPVMRDPSLVSHYLSVSPYLSEVAT